MKFYPPFPHERSPIPLWVFSIEFGCNALPLWLFQKKCISPPLSVTELSCPEPEANSDYYKSCLILGKENYREGETIRALKGY